MNNNTIFEYPIIIREAHLDTFGHVNNAVYLELFEEARWELITKGGYGLNYVRESGLGPTILEIKIRYSRELKLRQEITIKTQIASYNGKIGVIKQEMVDGQNQKYCEAEFTVGLFDTKLRKLVPPTPEWLKAIGFNES